MDKTHYKELIEKYFEETITDVEIKELSDWIKNDRQLHDWWVQRQPVMDFFIGLPDRT